MLHTVRAINTNKSNAPFQKNFWWGSGCSSVGIAVGIFQYPRTAVRTQSSAIFLTNIFPVNCRKDENEEKEAGNDPFFKNENL